MDLYPKDFTEQLEKEANEIKDFLGKFMEVIKCIRAECFVLMKKIF